MTHHQLHQSQLIEQIAQQAQNNSLQSTTVSPVDDYKNDTRICLTSVHLPQQALVKKVQQELIKPLQRVFTNCYYYPSENLHITIKNVRVINDPSNFTAKDLEKARQIFSEQVPQHKKFQVYFYRFVLFPQSLALVGTTDEELDRLILNLDQSLKENQLADDKVYANKQYFFSHMTLARFSQVPSLAFQQQLKVLSQHLKFEPYLVDSVTLLTANAVLQKRQLLGTWQLS